MILSRQRWISRDGDDIYQCGFHQPGPKQHLQAPLRPWKDLLGISFARFAVKVLIWRLLWRPSSNRRQSHNFSSRNRIVYFEVEQIFSTGQGTRWTCKSMGHAPCSEADRPKTTVRHGLTNWTLEHPTWNRPTAWSGIKLRYNFKR